ncbi:MAG: hypothetical protein LBU64_04920 [Planctomycetota bacterium]|jgi:hypothetical protein|nr:hypothetical protein [Planctomycetota bacterium]
MQRLKEELTTARVGRGRARIIGLGLDDPDGHFRFTGGDGYALIGGSGPVHGEMRRRIGLILAEAERRGINPERLTREQCNILAEIANRHSQG